jgi:hypothetical protein
MRRIVWVGLFVLAGCQGIQGPLQRRCRPELIDDPRVSVSEQEMRGRDRLALPEPSMNVAPRTYAEFPEYKGRVMQ